MERYLWICENPPVLLEKKCYGLVTLHRVPDVRKRVSLKDHSLDIRLHATKERGE
jgi:hypothetical protein